MTSCDVAIVGAGIVGLAHALAAVRRGLRVAVLDRDACADGASVRNFGFVTITGQAPGRTRERALRSRDVWMEVTAEAGVRVLQHGALVVARRKEAFAVLEEFAATPMGEGCRLHAEEKVRRALPVSGANVVGVLESPHELRIEARDAVARIAAWLEARGVQFLWGHEAVGLEGSRLRHSRGAIEAEAFVWAPGTHARGSFPEVAQRLGLETCRLHMMRIAPPAWRLPAVVLSDLSLIRYEGFASMPAAAALRRRLERECPRELARGIHLIVAQSADGSLVVGDSHDHADREAPGSPDEIEALILDELRAVLGFSDPKVSERWIGHYPVAKNGQPMARESLAPRARLVLTSGTGMSTAFAIGEETLEDLFGPA